jgi:hypothetical protein
MFRGGGGGAGGAAFGAQFAELLRSLGNMPLEDLLRIGLGLLLIIVIIVLIRRTPATRRGATMPRSTTCLICGQPLEDRVYADRYFPNWVACGDCYDDLTPSKQRQYQLVSRQPSAVSLTSRES